MPHTPPIKPTEQLNAHALLIQITKYPRKPLPEVFDAIDFAEVLGCGTRSADRR